MKMHNSACPEVTHLQNHSIFFMTCLVKDSSLTNYHNLLTIQVLKPLYIFMRRTDLNIMVQ